MLTNEKSKGEAIGIEAVGLKLLLRIHPINDGKKYKGAGTYRIYRKLGDACGNVRVIFGLEAELLLETLNGDGFISCYKAKVRTTPVMS